MKKYENGCCISAVLCPKSGLTVSAFGSRPDLRDTFGAMAYEFLKQGLLSYEDMLLQLQAAVLLNTPYKPR